MGRKTTLLRGTRHLDPSFIPEEGLDTPLVDVVDYRDPWSVNGFATPSGDTRQRLAVQNANLLAWGGHQTIVGGVSPPERTLPPVTMVVPQWAILGGALVIGWMVLSK